MIIFKNRAYRKICESIRRKDRTRLLEILRSGFDPNYTIGSGSPHALFIAVEEKWLEGIEILLRRGATCRGEISKAVSLKWEAGLEMLILPNNSKNSTGIVDAVRNNWKQGAQCFLKKGVTQLQLDTALHASISSRNRSHAIWLLEEGADPWTPLACSYSSFSDHYKCTPVEFDYVELTALDFAVSIDYLEILPDLLSCGKNMASCGQSAGDKKVQKFIHFAANHGSIIAIFHLLRELEHDQVTSSTIQPIALSILELVNAIKAQIRSEQNIQAALLGLRRSKYILGRLLNESSELFARSVGHQHFSNLNPVEYEIRQLPIVTSSIFRPDGSLRPSEGPKSPKYESSMPIEGCIGEIEIFLSQYMEVLGDHGLVVNKTKFDKRRSD